MPFYAADPEGFFGLEVDDRIIATISAVRCSPQVTFLGFYLVTPEFRGEGFGKRLWDEVLERVSNSTLVGDAVPEQLANYEADGFEVAYRNARFTLEAGNPTGSGKGLRPAGEVDFDQLVAFDAAHCFGPRPRFLREWISGEGRDSLVALDGNGRIRGFAASRKTSRGHRIGPVFCEERECAEALILTLAGMVGGDVSVDIPLPNGDAESMCVDLGMERSFETARIHRGDLPEIPLRRIWGVTSLELG